MTNNFNFDKVQECVKNLLEAMGQDVNRPGLVETPRRVAGYWEELLEGENYTNEEIAEKYTKLFTVPYSNLVVKQVDNVYSHCEHHLALMYNATAYVAYIPVEAGEWIDDESKAKGRPVARYNTKTGKTEIFDRQGYNVIGLSKIDRIVDLCSKRLQLQEKLAADIADCIGLATGSKQVYVQLIMNHGCVSARGPKSEGPTDVTFISEELKDNVLGRQEIETKIANLKRN